MTSGSRARVATVSWLTLFAVAASSGAAAFTNDPIFKSWKTVILQSDFVALVRCDVVGPEIASCSILKRLKPPLAHSDESVLIRFTSTRSTRTIVVPGETYFIAGSTTSSDLPIADGIRGNAPTKRVSAWMHTPADAFATICFRWSEHSDVPTGQFVRWPNSPCAEFEDAVGKFVGLPKSVQAAQSLAGTVSELARVHAKKRDLLVDLCSNLDATEDLTGLIDSLERVAIADSMLAAEFPFMLRQSLDRATLELVARRMRMSRALHPFADRVVTAAKNDLAIASLSFVIGSRSWSGADVLEADEAARQALRTALTHDVTCSPVDGMAVAALFTRLALDRGERPVDLLDAKSEWIRIAAAAAMLDACPEARQALIEATEGDRSWVSSWAACVLATRGEASQLKNAIECLRIEVSPETTDGFAYDVRSRAATLMIAAADLERDAGVVALSVRALESDGEPEWKRLSEALEEALARDSQRVNPVRYSNALRRVSWYY